MSGAHFIVMPMFGWLRWWKLLRNGPREFHNLQNALEYVRACARDNPDTHFGVYRLTHSAIASVQPVYVTVQQ